MMARFPSLARDSAGTVTIELALLSPLLGAMLVGLIDLSTAYSNKLRLEQVAQRTIEKVQQNGFTTGMEVPLETEAAGAAGPGAVADLTYWLECTADGTTRKVDYTAGCSDGEAYARYVQLDIVKSHTPIITARFGGSNADGTVEVRGIAGIRIQ